MLPVDLPLLFTRIQQSHPNSVFLMNLHLLVPFSRGIVWYLACGAERAPN